MYIVQGVVGWLVVRGVAFEKVSQGYIRAGTRPPLGLTADVGRWKEPLGGMLALGWHWAAGSMLAGQRAVGHTSVACAGTP